jgi:hypothetical protein
MFWSLERNKGTFREIVWENVVAGGIDFLDVNRGE